jgi:hypothetical protein
MSHNILSLALWGAFFLVSCTTKSNDNSCKVHAETWVRDSVHLQPIFDEKFSVHLLEDTSIHDSAILIQNDTLPWAPAEFSLKSYCQKYRLNYRLDYQLTGYFGMDSVRTNDLWEQEDCDSIPKESIGGHLNLFDYGIYFAWPVSGDCELEFSKEDFKPSTSGDDD